MDLSFLPAVNAGLNSIATILLIAGYVMVRQQRIDAHRKCMIGAFGMSCLFLVFYLLHYTWRAKVEGGTHTPYNAQGIIKTLYYLMLASHILLAMAVPFLAVRMIWLGLKNRVQQHRRLGRYALPIWLYVSITGVLIYLMLYHFNPPPPAV